MFIGSLRGWLDYVNLLVARKDSPLSGFNLSELVLVGQNYFIMLMFDSTPLIFMHYWRSGYV